MVALVVTVIILLILAGISISTLTGSGLFERAREAEQKSINGQQYENSILDEYENLIGDYTEVKEVDKTEIKGEGTQENPYKIFYVEQLYTISEEVKNGNNYGGKYFELQNDIDIGARYDEETQTWLVEKEWEYIGYSSSMTFNGNFDGNNHKIKGLPDALFGYIMEATIENLTVTDGYVYSQSGNTGGIVIKANDSEIRNCVNENAIQQTINGSIGGIVAYANETNIENCINKGKLNFNYNKSGDSNCGVAGIVGKIGNGTSIINRCKNTGNIMVNSNNKGVHGISGIVGIVVWESNMKSSIVEINQCQNIANISCVQSSGNSGSVGIAGILGHKKGQSGSINESYNTGNIELQTTAAGYAGGLCGYLLNSFNMNNSYNLGNVTVNEGERLHWASANASSTTKISNCYNNGDVVNTVEFGGVMTNCYEKGSTFSESDLNEGQDEEVWTSQPDINEGMPILKWQVGK